MSGPHVLRHHANRAAIAGLRPRHISEEFQIQSCPGNRAGKAQ